MNSFESKCMSAICYSYNYKLNGGLLLMSMLFGSLVLDYHASNVFYATVMLDFQAASGWGSEYSTSQHNINLALTRLHQKGTTKRREI